MSDELKPCPFCGPSKVEQVGSPAPAGRRWKLCRVVCMKCGAETDSYYTPAEAREAWNTRGTPSEDRVPILLAKGELIVRATDVGAVSDELRRLREIEAKRPRLPENTLFGGPRSRLERTYLTVISILLPIAIMFFVFALAVRPETLRAILVALGWMK